MPNTNMGHGALIQLSAVGVEDVDLKVDANHTFWKTTYAKATGFAMEPKDVPFSAGTADYGTNKATVTIIRSGDLVCDMYLVFKISALVAGSGGVLGAGRFVNDVGRAIIDMVAVDIGGVVYDTKQSEFIHLWEELSTPRELHTGRLTGNSETTADLVDWAKEQQFLYVPISFWFTDDYAQALPLVGLYQHDVRIDFSFRVKSDLIVASDALATYVVASETGGLISDMVLMVEYVFLENNERNYFARGSHKYMISQLQYLGMKSLGATDTTASFTVTFNHPTQELVWVFRKGSATTAKEWFAFQGYEPLQEDGFLTNRLMLNSSDRYVARDPHYFRQITPKRVHSRIPDKHIYVYSFALHPEQIDPSGSINFSRIDNTEMRFTLTAPGSGNTLEFHLWARSINWMKIERGLGKLFYA